MKTKNIDNSFRFGILLIHQFPIYVLMLIIESLRLTNKYLGESVYEWQIFTVDGAPAEASNGMTIMPQGDVNQMQEQLGNLCVLSGYKPEQAYTPEILSRLRYLSLRGTRIGGIDTGAFILAKAGLLTQCPTTVHWEALSSFQEAYPLIETADGLYTIKANRFTCAGGSSILDLMLKLISLDQGYTLSQKVAQDFVHDNIRVASDDQRIAQDHQWLRYNPQLANIIKVMEDHLENPISIHDLISMSGRSKRQLERIFQRDLGVTPMRYYLQMRINKAQQLIKYSTLPIRTIAISCGFSSMPSFSRSYRKNIGIAPRDHRVLFRKQSGMGYLPSQEKPLDIGTTNSF